MRVGYSIIGQAKELSVEGKTNRTLRRCSFYGPFWSSLGVNGKGFRDFRVSIECEMLGLRV